MVGTCDVVGVEGAGGPSSAGRAAASEGATYDQTVAAVA